MEKKTVKNYEAAVAAFIKENKPKGSVFYDDLSNQLALQYTLDATAMEKLIQKVEDAGISVVDENGDPSEHSLKKDEKAACVALFNNSIADFQKVLTLQPLRKDIIDWVTYDKAQIATLK